MELVIEAMTITIEKIILFVSSILENDKMPQILYPESKGELEQLSNVEIKDLKLEPDNIICEKVELESDWSELCNEIINSKLRLNNYIKGLQDPQYND